MKKEEYINEEQEIDIILSFIEEWQKKNVYIPEKLHEYNAKFRKDLKVFFESSNFIYHTIEWILN